MKQIIFAFLLLSSATLIAQQSFQKKLQTEFITTENGGTITIEAGEFSLDKSVWMDGKENIVIQGAGMDKTILSFKDQKDGAEGIKITNAKNIILKDLTVLDASGDAIKTQDVDGISFINVKTEWSAKASKKNGAYGLYPVQCQNVLIDGCVAIGASDAGIYVGQSNKVIVKNSKAFRNVAGIEIENTTNADVFDCVARGNTGGILVFDLPGLVQKKGGNVRVFNNVIVENNYKNFAPKGNTVALIPPGTGVLILATSNVEVYNNKITNNRSLGCGIASYYITETPIKDDTYDPYPASIYVHDNTFEKLQKGASVKSRMGKLLRLKFKRDMPNIIYDGVPNEDQWVNTTTMKAEYQICITNNTNGTFGNLDAANGFKNVNKDASIFDCTRTEIEQVPLDTMDDSEK